MRELRRKAIHLTGLSVPLVLVVAGQMAAAAFVGTALAASAVLEWLRLSGRIRLPEVRTSEQGRVAGYVFFIMGSLLVVILFKPMVAVLSMLMLCLGDAASGIMGSVLLGSNVRDDRGPRRRRKPLAVSAGMLTACSLIGYATSGLTNLAPSVYLAGAVGATLADSIPLFLRGRSVDDNFTIPVLSGLCMTLAALA